MVFLKRSFVKILLWLLRILGSIFNVIIAINVIHVKKRYARGGDGHISLGIVVLMRLSNTIRKLIYMGRIRG